jgi:hypothetical protein
MSSGLYIYMTLKKLVPFQLLGAMFLFSFNFDINSTDLNWTLTAWYPLY